MSGVKKGFLCFPKNIFARGKMGTVRLYIKVYFYMKFGRLRFLGGLLKFKMADSFRKNSILYLLF